MIKMFRATLILQQLQYTWNKHWSCDKSVSDIKMLVLQNNISISQSIFIMIIISVSFPPNSSNPLMILFMFQLNQNNWNVKLNMYRLQSTCQILHLFVFFVCFVIFSNIWFCATGNMWVDDSSSSTSSSNMNTGVKWNLLWLVNDLLPSQVANSL